MIRRKFNAIIGALFGEIVKMIELIYFLVFLLVSFSIGRKILPLFRLKIDFLEEIIFGICFGYIILGYLTFFLAVFGLLYQIIFYFIFIIGIIILLFDLPYIVKKVRSIKLDLKFGFNLNTILILILVFFIFINLIPSMAPVWGFDATGYHLAVPKLYMRAHSFVYLPWIIESNMPFFTEMLYLIGMILENGVLAQLIGYSFGILLVLAIFSFSKRFFSFRAGLFAALIFFTVPSFMEVLVRPESDVPLALFCFLAIYTFAIWLKNIDLKWLVVSAIMTGIALSIKYTAGIGFIALLFFMLINLFTLKEKGLFYKAKLFILFFIIAILVFSPWLIKNYYYTSNPVFPLLYDTFGGKYLTKENVLTLMGIGGGIKVDLLDYILLPWHLTMSILKFPSIMGIGAAFLAFVPLFFFLSRKRFIHYFILGFSFLAITAWFFTGFHYIRFLLFALPGLSIISALTVCLLLDYNNKAVKRITLLVLLSVLLFSAVLWVGMNMKHFPVIFGFESEEQFYDKLKDYNLYEASKFINENTPPDSKILIVKDARGYFMDRGYIRYNIHYTTYFNEFDTDEKFINWLKGAGVTHILINHNFDNVSTIKVVYDSHNANNLFMNLTTKYSEKIYGKRGIEIFRLK